MVKHPKKKRGGFWTFVVVLLLLAGGGFALLLLHFDESPAQAWTRVVAAVQQAVDYFQPRPVPTPAPTTPAPTPAIPAPTPVIVQATPSATVVPLPSATPPDPLQWLLGHQNAWPRQIALKKDTLFPIFFNGVRNGSGNVLAGSPVVLKRIIPAARTVVVAYPAYGSEQEVGIDATNLLELASVALRAPASPAPGPAVATLRPANAASLPVLRSASAADRPAGYTQPSISVLVSDPATPTVNQPIVELKDRGTTVLLEATPENFTPSSYAWKQVKDESNSYATTGHADFSSAETSKPVVQVVLPEKGIYQFEVTATDRNQGMAKTRVWVNVWDPVPALGPDHKVGRNPGIAPPASVRVFSADPGPFHHPRLFFSWQDWSELSAKVAPNSKVPEARAACQILQEDTQKTFDHAGSGLNQMAQALLAYAKSGYAEAEQRKVAAIAESDPELSKDSILSYYNDARFPDALAVACYLAWLGPNPATKHLFVPHEQADRLTYLATLTAAFARFQLGKPEACYGVALSYDLTYDWMTPAQQNDTRDYLFSIGNRYNTYGGGISPEKPSQKPPPGSQQNGGDFPNLSDGIILPALAIEGEEGKVSAAVRGNTAQYGTYTPAPAGPASWPSANDCSVNNLQRQIHNNSEYMVTPWGFELNNYGYWQLGQNVSSPTILALARRGENQWVTTNIYQAHLAALYSIGPREADGLPDSFEHHDSSGFGNGDGSRNEIYLAKYMYPDDPMIDYIYRAATRDWKRNALPRAIFGAPLLGTNLEQVAQAKKLELTKLDPMHGVAVSRNGWKENDLTLYFENFPLGRGHYHAEANDFSLFALGRAWSCAPGYHIVPGDAQSQVLIHQKGLEPDPATEGYLGEGPSSYSELHEPPPKGGPFHGTLFEVVEDPKKLWTWFAGDAKPTYDYVEGGNESTGIKLGSLVYKGLLATLLPFDQERIETTVLKGKKYNPVLYAYRSVLTVRGAHPYVLIIDDIDKDDAKQDYRWSMGCYIGFGPSGGRFVDRQRHDTYSSLAIEPRASATEAVLYHEIDGGTTAGLPRLLVRDLSGQPATGQPAIRIDDRPPNDPKGNLTYGIDNNRKEQVPAYFPTRRVFIDRNNVVAPAYKILLFPYLTGGVTPTTTWDATHTTLTVQAGGQTDRITLDVSEADHRTRLSSFVRTGQ